MLKKRENNQKGFTLVELIIVIAILGILAALLVPRIMGNVDDANKNSEISNARTIASEITTYNALQKIEGNSVFGANSTLTATALSDPSAPSEIRIDSADFPDPNIVTIEIDAEGNASIDY